MKKVLKIVGISITVIVAIVSMNYYGFFSRYNYLTAKWDAFNGNYQILVYGEPSRTDLFTEEENFNFKNTYGYQYKRVTDCSISQSEFNGIESYNWVMEEEINNLNLPQNPQQHNRH